MHEPTVAELVERHNARLRAGNTPLSDDYARRAAFWEAKHGVRVGNANCNAHVRVIQGVYCIVLSNPMPLSYCPSCGTVELP